MIDHVPVAKRRDLLTEQSLDWYTNWEVGLCSLCGNSGIIDTRETAISPRGIKAGRLNFCCCPNGTGMRESGRKPEDYVDR